MTRRVVAYIALFLLLVTAPLTARAQQSRMVPKLTVAISLDIPPYVMDKASRGLQIDILHGALPGYTLDYLQVPYGKIETAVQDGRADLAASVRGTGAGETGHVFYSDEFVRFANFAITKVMDNRKIATVGDLAGAQVLTWQGADLDLGGAFLKMFGAGAPYRGDYVEFADQAAQVRAFWQRDGAVAVIDGAIFAYFSEQAGHAAYAWVKHAIFPPVTGFKVGFKDAGLRDTFNAGLAALCRDGRYAAFLDQYRADASQSVCR